MLRLNRNCVPQTPMHKANKKAYKDRTPEYTAQWLVYRCGRAEAAGRIIHEYKHLYVMTCAELPGNFKVGRSNGVVARMKDLNNGHCFTVEILAIYEGSGILECVVNDRLTGSGVGALARATTRASRSLAMQRRARLFSRAASSPRPVFE